MEGTCAPTDAPSANPTGSGSAPESQCKRECSGQSMHAPPPPQRPNSIDLRRGFKQSERMSDDDNGERRSRGDVAAWATRHTHGLRARCHARDITAGGRRLLGGGQHTTPPRWGIIHDSASGDNTRLRLGGQHTTHTTYGCAVDARWHHAGMLRVSVARAPRAASRSAAWCAGLRTSVAARHASSSASAAERPRECSANLPREDDVIVRSPCGRKPQRGV